MRRSKRIVGNNQFVFVGVIIGPEISQQVYNSVFVCSLKFKKILLFNKHGIHLPGCNKRWNSLPT